MTNRSSISRAWRERSRREQWLLAGALIASLLSGSYWLAKNHVLGLIEHISHPSRVSPALVSSLPPVLSVKADDWRRAALEQGLVLNNIEVQDNSVVTQGEARTPEAFVAFSRWAAQHGWWALEWTLTREAEASLTLEARWMSQLEESALVRRAP